MNIYGDSPPPGLKISYNHKGIYKLITERLQYNKEGKCTNASKILRNPFFLKLAYESIRSKPGNSTKGSDSELLDGIPRTWFHSTSKKLKAGSFNFRPSRRVWIPKPHGGLRPLGIACPRDKIVQQSARLVMEHVLNPKFLECSHGFRPKRGCHSALKKIRSWSRVSWFIEGDIKSFFDRIDHHLLAELLKKHFDDPDLLTLYWKLVKAGYLEWDPKKKRRDLALGDIGVPQGGILSPLLSNVILHELDKFVEDLIDKQKKVIDGTPRSISNKKYSRLTYQITKNRKELEALRSQGLPRDHWRPISRELGKNLRRRRLVTSISPNPAWIKFNYVRYADDWLIGIWGPASYARHLKAKIKTFLETLKLELNLKKTLITSAWTGRAKFLSTLIRVPQLTDGKNTLTVVGKKSGRRIKSSNFSVRLSAPIGHIVKKLQSKQLGFSKPQGAPHSSNKIEYPKAFLVLPLRDLLIRYRSILSGYLNYYSFVSNRPRLKYIYNILKCSLIGLIKNKSGMGIREVLRRYGPQITLQLRRKDGTIARLDFRCPPLFSTPNRFLGEFEFKGDPLSVVKWKISTIDPMGQCCANCGTDERIEMHHLKHIKTINPKLNKFDKSLARINRKQVPLCRPCHLKVHLGVTIGLDIRHHYFIPFGGEAKWC